MRKILFIVLFTLCAIISKAQLGIGVGAGWSWGYSAPVAELDVSIMHPERCIFIGGGFLAHMDNKHPVAFNADIGAEFHITQLWGFRVKAGISREVASMDDKSLNKTYILSGIEAIKKMPHTNGEYILSFSHYRNNKFLTLGIRGLIP